MSVSINFICRVYKGCTCKLNSNHDVDTTSFKLHTGSSHSL